MKNYRPLAFVFILFLASCSSVFGGSTSSEGDQSLSDAPVELLFEADVDTTSFRSITFTNRTDEDYSIYNLALINNVCGSFSVFDIQTPSGQLLYKGEQSVDVIVKPTETVHINIQFSPTACQTTEYISSLIIYYNQADEGRYSPISLVASVNDNTPDTLLCEETDLNFYDEFDNPTERKLPALPEGEKYYLKVVKMNAYMQTTGGFLSFSTQVGTHINLDAFDEDELFQPVYIPLTTDEDGNINIPTFNECLKFELPTPSSDTFFIGASVAVTTTQDYQGTIDRSETLGRITIPNIQFRLSSFINNSDSLLQDPNGQFELDTVLTLTTGSTEENSFLADLIDLTDDDGATFLNIIDDKLEGKDLRHGTLTLVGIGTFIETDTIKVSNEGFQATIENESYLFLQIEGLVTQVDGSIQE